MFCEGLATALSLASISKRTFYFFIGPAVWFLKVRKAKVLLSTCKSGSIYLSNVPYFIDADNALRISHLFTYLVKRSLN